MSIYALGDVTSHGMNEIRTDQILSKDGSGNFIEWDGTSFNAKNLALPTLTDAENSVVLPNGRVASIVDGGGQVTGELRVHDGVTSGGAPILPAGAIMPFAMNTQPVGWLICNGASNVSKSAFPALWDAIGEIWGVGDDSDHFKLPDLRGVFLRGFGTAQGSANFAEYQDDRLRNHVHGLLTGSNRDTGGYGTPGWVDNQTTAFEGQTRFTTLASGSIASDTETRPKNYAVLYCIKY